MRHCTCLSDCFYWTILTGSDRRSVWPVCMLWSALLWCFQSLTFPTPFNTLPKFATSFPTIQFTRILLYWIHRKKSYERPNGVSTFPLSAYCCIPHQPNPLAYINQHKLLVVHIPWLRFFRDFSSVVRWMPGYNTKSGHGSHPPPPPGNGGFILCQLLDARLSSENATLVSNPRELSIQSIPPYLRRLYAPRAVALVYQVPALNRDYKTLA
jgi:hypothetical protein